MNWKSWPYWVRGGIIGVLLCIVFILLIFTYQSTIKGSAGWLTPLELFTFVSSLPLQEFVFWPLLGHGDNIFEEELAIPTTIISWFIVGVVFGYLYGKFKNRKKSTTGFPFPRE